MEKEEKNIKIRKPRKSQKDEGVVDTEKTVEEKAPKKSFDAMLSAFGSKLSLQLFVFLFCVILCTLLLFVYSSLSSKMNYKTAKEQLVGEVERACDKLSDNLSLNDYKISGTNDLHLIIDDMAASFDGRIVVVDSDYLVIKDTFKEEEGAYIVSEDVIDVMLGEKSSVTREDDDCVEYICSVTSDKCVRSVIIFDASKSNIKSISARSHKKNGVLFAALFLVILGMGALLGKGCVRGILKINRSMEGYREGHLVEKIKETGFKEFRTLTSNYNGTIERLMVIDSTRQEFVSNVSHELKTPITSMKVLADSLVQNPDADLDMYKEFMTDIVEEIDRETKIINDLLTLVKMDKKEAEISIEDVDINALLEMIVKRVTPIAASRSIEINFESYKNVVAQVDEVKLSLALNNIIENAVKYNVDKGWVKVTLNADHTHFHIRVSDSGVGIPDDCKDHVFERFYRVDKARSRDTGGTGLGLAITQNVIRMHKGSIKLYSESGEGTTFTIKIPLKYSKGE